MHADDSPPRRSGRARGPYRGEQKIEDSPLIKAARMGDAFGVRMNMERWKRKPDALGNYALHIAAQANNVDIVQYLAEHEAELKNKDGETPLMVALSAKALSSAILLVRYSDFETDAKGYGLLEHALQGNSLECVQCVVLYFKPSPEQIYPVLEEAHRLGRIEIAKFLENVMNNIIFIDCGECWKLLQKYGSAIAATEKFSEQLRIIEEAKSEAQHTEEQQIPESLDVRKSSISTSRKGSVGRRNEPGRSNSVTFSDTVTVMGAELTSSNKDPGLMEQEILDLKARLNKLTVDLDLKSKENESLLVQLQAAGEAAKVSKSRPKTKDQEAELVSRAELDKAATLISQQQLRIDELEQILAHSHATAVKDSSTDQSAAQPAPDDQGKKKQAKKKKDTKEVLEKDKQIVFLQDQLLESEKRCTRLLSELDEAKNKQVPSPHLIPYMQLEKSYKVMQEDLLRQESKVLDLQNTINKLRAEVSNKNALLTQARGIIASQKEHLGGAEKEKRQGKGASQKSAERRSMVPVASYDDDTGADADPNGLHRSSSQGIRQTRTSKSQALTLPSKPGKVKQLPPWRGLIDEPNVDLPSKSQQQDPEQEYLFREHDDLAKDYSNSPAFQHTEPLASSMMNSDAGSRNSPTIKSLASPIQSSPLRVSPTLFEVDTVRDSSLSPLRTISPHSPLQAATNVTSSPSRNQQALPQNMVRQDNGRGALVKVGPSKGFVSVRQHNPHLFSTDTIIEASIDSNVNSYGTDTVSLLADPSVLAGNSPTKVLLPTAGRRVSGGYAQGGGGGSFASASNISYVEASFNAPASPQQMASSQGVPTRNSLGDQSHHIEPPDSSNPIRNMINSSYGMQQPVHQSTVQMATASGPYLPPTTNLEGHVSRIPHPSYKQPAFSFRVGNVLQGPGDDNIYNLYAAPSNPPYNTGYAAKSYMHPSSVRS
ncbi:Ankyrin repeat protein 1 [Giardia duodenalis]|uniref:Ankyrin repeat protein 1 n=1 Tax=Giardia intestinalis (strain ATCC 50803 / WB clone C6) TaxID=184922 RepID=A8B349_GIAIC|nr:Ankyrin repeat protein 1 [Giardia intestinalis]KAE8303100.1 Ankyrin repeat protein 1 [Giardia intestinalis]|eukprot:XP_001710124.1 Hypothetical protein GL50803_6542 [Giardia lamblia ATCC 50803]